MTCNCDLDEGFLQNYHSWIPDIWPDAEKLKNIICIQWGLELWVFLYQTFKNGNLGRLRYEGTHSLMGLFKDINLNSRLLGYLQPLIILSLWKFLDQDLLWKSVRRKNCNAPCFKVNTSGGLILICFNFEQNIHVQRKLYCVVFSTFELNIESKGIQT